jgi:hypothetical protein
MEPAVCFQIRYKDNGVTRKTKTWYLQFYVNGKRIRESSRTEDKREAQKKLTQRLAAIGTGRAVGEVKGVRYEAVRDAWLTYPRKNRKLKTAYTKPDGTRLLLACYIWTNSSLDGKLLTSMKLR